MVLIQLTDLGGGTIYVNPDTVERVIQDDGFVALIFVSGQRQAVQEGVQTVVNRLEGLEAVK